MKYNSRSLGTLFPDLFSRFLSLKYTECPDPGFLDNGDRQVTSRTEGSQVRWSCLGDHVLQGADVSTCSNLLDEQGRLVLAWQPNVPECVGE